MTDPDLILKKLAVIESVSELRTVAHSEAISQDVKEQRFVEHTLRIAIQAALDVASHHRLRRAPGRTTHEPGSFHDPGSA